MAAKWVPFYNIDKAVGPYAPNQPDDVMLVQFFLSRIAAAATTSIARPETPIQVNGVYTPELSQWILWYQKSNNTSGVTQLVADGRVDPMQGVRGAEQGAMPLTINALNRSYRRRFRASHDTLDQDQSVPAQLRQRFAASEFPA
ncbi:MAG: hypothetical protein JNL98_14900 [Bryobacterales bacterium]|nr:hypothetical protein [Bryobacterales bacterium]